MFAKTKAKGGAKLKEPKVPTKGEKTKKAPKASVTARAKPAGLSEEFIQDTDNEDGGDGPSTEESSSGHDADSASEAEQRMNTKKPKMKRAKKTEPEEVPVPDDTSDEEESGEDEKEEGESESSAEEELKELKVNGTKRKAESKDDAREAKKRKKASKAEAKASESSSEEDEPAQTKTNPKAPAPSAPTSQHTSRPTPSLPFKPPPGYTPLSTSSTPAALTSTSLSGKQIWHITAPSSIPLSSISTVALNAIQTGKPVLTHKGANYILAEDTGPTATATTLFLPNEEGYAPCEKTVERTLHLQQKITLPNLSAYQADPATAGSAAAADVATAAVRGPKPQPKGLRMRYRPIGHVSGQPGIDGSEDGSGEEQEAAPAKKKKKGKKEAAEEGVQFPMTLGANGVSEAEVAANGVEKAASTSKKSEKANEKKKRKSKVAAGEEETAKPDAATSVAEQPGWSFDAIGGKTGQDAKTGEEEGDVTMADVDDTVVTKGDAGESKEEKAKRKEERRALREKKAARKAKRESGVA